MGWKAMGNHVVDGNTIISSGKNAPWDEQVRNARLMAAAPDLLEVLKMVVQNYETSMDDYEQILAALKKAEGV